MFPDLFNAKVNGQRAVDQVEMDWYEDEYIRAWASRALRSSRPAGRRRPPAPPTPPSTTCATGSASGADGLRSMAVPVDGSYGVQEGVISSFPVRVSGGTYSIQQGLEVGARPEQDRRHGEGAQG